MIRLKGAAFARRSNGGFEILAEKDLRFPGGFDARFQDDPSWLTELTEKKSTQAVDNLGAGGVFEETGVEFITPIVFDGRMEAMIFLGEKRSETNYAREDVELLSHTVLRLGGYAEGLFDFHAFGFDKAIFAPTLAAVSVTMKRTPRSSVSLG